jgi:ABC-type nitrate/sulfonate/bicarbonate transport system permease component
MNKFLENPRTTSSLGFLLLPIVLILLCTLANVFAPATLQFPKPQLIFQDIFKSLSEQSVWSVLSNTLINLTKALSLSLFFGVLLGLFLGLNKSIWNLSQPTVDFFRSIPVTFLIPAVALLIGVTSANIVWILATYPCLLIIIFNVRAGISKQEPERVHSFHIISGSTNLLSRFFKVTFYEILPDIFSGFRIALSYDIVIITVLEYMRLGNKTGIGGLINDELQSLNYVRVYALTFIIGILGFVLNKFVEIIQQRFIHWSFYKDN